MATERLAIVTGVTRGIGRAIAERLLDDDWSVIGAYRASAPAAEELARRHAPRLELVGGDLGTRAGVELLLEAVGDRSVDALVNNAGVIEFEGESFDSDLWQRTFAVNLHAPVWLTLALAQRNLGKGAAVVNVSSTDALRGSYASMAYSASKAALLNATQSLANIVGARGIRVNAVSPGWIATEMAETVPKEVHSLTPLGRLGDPREVADCVAWLVTEATFVNGANVVVDGGLVNVDYILKREAEEES